MERHDRLRIIFPAVEELWITEAIVFADEKTPRELGEMREPALHLNACAFVYRKLADAMDLGATMLQDINEVQHG